MLTLRQQAALVIKSLMCNAQISGHVVYPEGEKAVSARTVIDQLEAAHVGDGSGDAAQAIGEHAFRAGWEARAKPRIKRGTVHEAWSDYDPPEDIKALS